MRIVLVRHATCAQMDSVLLGRAFDSPLDARGEAQAEALAERFSSWPSLLLQASPRRRTRQTAAAIARRRGDEVQVVPEVDEVDFGAWCGRSFAELSQDPSWRLWNEQRSQARTPAGETIEDVRARAVGHLCRLAQLYPTHTVAVVTHAEIIRTVVLHALNAPLDEYHRIEISPASLTTLNVRGSHFDVSSLNERVYA